jgi:hypothetical protein
VGEWRGAVGPRTETYRFPLGVGDAPHGLISVPARHGRIAAHRERSLQPSHAPRPLSRATERNRTHSSHEIAVAAPATPVHPTMASAAAMARKREAQGYIRSLSIDRMVPMKTKAISRDHTVDTREGRRPGRTALIGGPGVRQQRISPRTPYPPESVRARISGVDMSEGGLPGKLLPGESQEMRSRRSRLHLELRSSWRRCQEPDAPATAARKGRARASSALR